MHKLAISSNKMFMLIFLIRKIVISFLLSKLKSNDNLTSLIENNKNLIFSIEKLKSLIYLIRIIEKFNYFN